MMDNKKGNIRVAEIEGFYTEMGSIYAHDITGCQREPGAPWEPIELTDSQKKFRSSMTRMIF
jgi:hypothetical protein